MDVKHENNGHELRLYYTYTEAYRLAQLAERTAVSRKVDGSSPLSMKRPVLPRP